MKRIHSYQSAAIGVALLLSLAQIGSGPTKPVSELRVDKIEFFRYRTKDERLHHFPKDYSGNISLMLIGDGLDDGVVMNSLPEFWAEIYCGKKELSTHPKRRINLLFLEITAEEFEKCLDEEIALAEVRLLGSRNGYVKDISKLFPTGHRVSRKMFERTPMLTYDEYNETRMLSLTPNRLN